MNYSRQPNEDWGELAKLRSTGLSSRGSNTNMPSHFSDKREAVKRNFIDTSHLNYRIKEIIRTTNKQTDCSNKEIYWILRQKGWKSHIKRSKRNPSFSAPNLVIYKHTWKKDCQGEYLCAICTLSKSKTKQNFFWNNNKTEIYKRQKSVTGRIERTQEKTRHVLEL